ncbi:MAG TPA: hypothetical protein VGA66_15715 [Mycobacterium sp.]
MTEVQHPQHQAPAGHAGHGAHGGHGHDDHVAAFRRLFWVMLVLAVPTVALSGMFAMILGYTVPLAAGVLAPIGFVLPMSVGAILMSVSTVVVAANAQLLRRLDLRPEASVRAVL